MAPGRNSNSVEPSSAPLISAPEMLVAACTATRCWRIKPGRARPARILLIRSGADVSRDRASEERSTWPPPSPIEPSIAITVSSLHTHDLSQSVRDIHQLTLGVHHVVDRLVTCRRFVN